MLSSTIVAARINTVYGLFVKRYLLRLAGRTTPVTAMIGQSKISAFFAPKAVQKRSLSDCQAESADDHDKKAMIEKKKQEAIQKLQAKQIANAPEHMGLSWKKALAAEFSKPYFIKLQELVERERNSHTIYPPRHQVYSWSLCCDIREVKVVILGQDPYHGPRQAHGLCFSVQKGVHPPPSLENMFKELSKEYEDFQHPGHGYLNGWAKQGVLLLNAVLTVKASNANSHKDKGWETFTDAVITWLSKNLHGVVFLLWGSYAQKKGAIIDKKKHHILKAVHPSPLSAHRGYFGCNHFYKANELLKKEGKKPIDWKHLPLDE
ncbi:uracil-DNA glycosylase-like isoform X2 [Ptychodera flava]|uniref:uracil-DNA glycosylase-like isoform X2 n=1 Tax=Ptychodera flava TaxID=63121 RepID=UPI00396A6E06